MYEKALNSLRAAAEKIIAIPDEEWAFLLSKYEYRTFPKGAFLAKPGEMADHSYTILKGVVRVFYADDEGREFNKSFFIENTTVCSFSSLLFGEPCRYHIQALEDTTAASCSKAINEELWERHPCWEHLKRHELQQYLLFKEKREKEFILDTLEERYRVFLGEYPDLCTRIPQYHIASYLGVTDVALSRMRSRLKANSHILDPMRVEEGCHVHGSASGNDALHGKSCFLGNEEAPMYQQAIGKPGL